MQRKNLSDFNERELKTLFQLTKKLSFCWSFSLHSHLFLPRADLLESWPLVVWRSLVVVVLVSAHIKPTSWFSFQCALQCSHTYLHHTCLRQPPSFSSQSETLLYLCLPWQHLMVD